MSASEPAHQSGVLQGEAGASVDSSSPPAAPPLTWQQLATRDGLPEVDRQLISLCTRRALLYGSLTALAAGGLAGGFVYRNRLMTPRRRFAVAFVSTVWGVMAGTLVSSPACFRAIAACDDSQSVLRSELAALVVRHNPNSAQDLVRVEDKLRERKERDAERLQRGRQQKET